MTTRVRKQSATRWVGRYVAGRPIDGYPRTNATFIRRADKILAESGRASRWAMLPGWKRAAWRISVPVAAGSGCVGYAIDPTTTTATAGTAATAAAGWAAYRGHQYVRNRRYVRRVVRPLVAALVPFTELPEAEIRDQLVLPGPGADLATAQIRVPLANHHAGRKAPLEDIGRIIQQRIGGEWDAGVNLREAPFYVQFSPRPAPPGLVTYDMIRDAVLATTQDKPVLGLGARADTIHLDFTGEIAHLAASIGTGGGKSSLLRFLVAQFAHHGVRDFDVCDVKWISLQGMEDVPGLTIYRDVQEIWDAIAIARAEMDRRYREMLANPRAVFPRKIIVLEEQNAFALETFVRWREVRGKDKRNLAPVWNDIALLLVKARQVNMNLIGVYQRMTADACGGGTLRDQYGLKLLSRFSPQAWDTLVGTRPRGVSSAVAGRAIAVLGGLHRTVQLPFITVEQAMELATSGPDVTVTADATQQATAPARCDVTPAEPRFTLAEAAGADWCPLTYDTLRQRATRARRAGRLVAHDDKRYTRDELAAAGVPIRLEPVIGGDSE